MNADTFTRLYRLHYRALWLLAAAWGVPWDECADMAHEAFLRAWQTGQEPEGDGGGWLWVIARNLLSDDRRKWLARGRRVNYDILLDTQGLDDGDDVDDRVQVALCLARLEPPERLVVQLLAEGYTGEEVGARMGGLTKTSVYRRYYYALALMRGVDVRHTRHGGRTISRGNAIKDLGWTPAV